MLYAIVAVLILIADQAVKYWTSLHLELNTGIRELIPGLINLRNLHNSGSAFSMLDNWNGARWLFLAVTVAFTVLVILALAKKVIRGGFGRWMAVGVLAGALGNGIDRSIYGYVVDMFEFDFFKRFPVFNVADIFITVCGILFCLYILLSKEPFGAPEKATRVGPGGSVVTKPEPRRVEKPAKAEKAPKPEKKAPAAEEKPAAPAAEKKPAGRRLASAEKPAKIEKAPAEKPAGQMPAAEKKPAEEKPAAPAAEERPAGRRLASAEKPAGPERTKRARRAETSEEEDPFARLKRPVVTHESFVEMTKHKSGGDPFAEWMQAAEKTEAREVTPEPVAAPETEVKAAPETEPTPVPAAAPEIKAVPTPAAEPENTFDIDEIIRRTVGEAKTAAPAPAVPEAPAAEEALKAAPLPEVNVTEDAVYSLEDILNEFRDL